MLLSKAGVTHRSKAGVTHRTDRQHRHRRRARAGNCHAPINTSLAGSDLIVALAGNPNVGKSSLFNWLTGLTVETANYPGKTVGLNLAAVKFDHQQIGVIDLPGIYGLGATSEDQWVARQAVLEGRADVIVVIVDATNLQRNLYLVLQLIELGLPVVVALNLVDEAARHGIKIDTARLQALLGVPVIETIATQGSGIKELLTATLAVRQHHLHAAPQPAVQPSPAVERAIAQLVPLIEEHLAETPYHLPPRALATLLLEEEDLHEDLLALPGGEIVIAEVRRLRAGLRQGRDEDETATTRLAGERHRRAACIAEAVEIRPAAREPLSTRLWRLTISPHFGLPLLLVVLSATFFTLYNVGNVLSEVLATFWSGVVSPAISGTITFLVGEGTASRVLLWGLDAGIEAALEIGIPYVLTFYLILALLEDSGYLNAMAFLLDNVMRRFGLEGRAAIVIMAAAGCNVPAIMGTRVLTNSRQRTIASTLAVLTPCSARTAVILGGVAAFAGWQVGLAIYGITLALIALTGLGLNWMLRGKNSGLLMEMFPLRIPTPRNIARKTWFRLQDFVIMAMPIVIVGSLFMGLLYETGWIWALTAPLKPVVEDWLGLPPIAGLTLLVAILRKELALQFLFTLALVQFGEVGGDLSRILNPQQLFVYSLVNTIYIPCIATIGVLGRELGWRRAGMISAFTIALAILVGGVARYLLAIGY